MLLEGTAVPAGDGTDEERRRKPAPGVTRLQKYTAEPSYTGTAAVTQQAPVSSVAGARAGAPAAPVTDYVPGAASRGGAPSFAIPSAVPAEAESTGAITVEEKEQEAKTYRARRAKEMSWDDYLDLNNRERAAVDFNTMLIQARQKDLRKQDDYAPNDAQTEVYDKTVERMFGETGVSETFAPETVALLNDIGFEKTDAKRFDDLDDFLGLSAALSVKDLDKMGKLKAPEPVGTPDWLQDLPLGVDSQVPGQRPNETAADVATVLAAGTNQMQEALTRGNQVLENWKLVSAGARNETLAFYGGLPNKVASPDIRLGPNDEYFQLAFDTLADATNGPEVMELIRKDLGDKDFNRFVAYADTKSKYSQDLGVGLGGDPTVQYRSPEEFREVLGLNKGGEPDAG